ncbi:hypothetical protein LINPERHAP2_LOCUS9737 [Linum perenne]
MWAMPPLIGGYSNDDSNNITSLYKPSIVHNPPTPVVREQPQ